MIIKSALPSVVLSLFQIVAGPAVSGTVATEDEMSRWRIEGQSSVATSEQLLKRLTGRSNESAKELDSFSILWPDALLTAEGRPPLRVRLELTLDAGQTMILGPNTPYPGLITKLTDARGTLLNLESGYAALLLLSERDSWIGKFMHSVVARPDSMSAEIPFSLYDAKTELLIAENNLLVRFDLTDPTAPKVVSAKFSPTPTIDLHNQTTDVGKGITGQSISFRDSELVQREVYDAAVTNSKVVGVAERDVFADLFSLESLDLYQCGVSESMVLEVDSPGFMLDGQRRTAPFSLQLKFMPSLIDTANQATYLEPLSGVLTLHQKGGPVSFEIGPGNHGRVASRAQLQGTDIHFDLGIAMRDRAGPPVIAQLLVSCSKTDSTCKSIRLSTAADSLGRVASRRSISAQLENSSPRALGFDPAPVGISKISADPYPLGGPQPCPYICPVCYTNGCTASGDCAEAPIGCGSPGCPHSGGYTQCCRGGSGRLCCVQRCGVPDH